MDVVKQRKREGAGVREVYTSSMIQSWLLRYLCCWLLAAGLHT